jgi:hypothetical protein
MWSRLAQSSYVNPSAQPPSSTPPPCLRRPPLRPASVVNFALTNYSLVFGHAAAAAGVGPRGINRANGEMRERPEWGQRT